MSITPDTPLAEVVTRVPAALKVLERRGVDYCCGGARPIGEACAALGLDVDTVLGEVAAASVASRDAAPAFDRAPLGDLVRHILERHHRPLREELARLSAMTARVVKAHGPRHPELVGALEASLRELRGELEPHMLAEEDVAFPAILRLENLKAAGRSLPAGETEPGTAIRALVAEHEAVGRSLRRLRELSGGYTAPEGTCATFRGLMEGLAEMEEDLHRHIHLENNILFPAAARLLGELAPAPLPAA